MFSDQSKRRQQQRTRWNDFFPPISLSRFPKERMPLFFFEAALPLRSRHFCLFYSRAKYIGVTLNDVRAALSRASKALQAITRDLIQPKERPSIGGGRNFSSTKTNRLSVICPENGPLDTRAEKKSVVKRKGKTGYADNRAMRVGESRARNATKWNNRKKRLTLIAIDTRWDPPRLFALSFAVPLVACHSWRPKPSGKYARKRRKGNGGGE